MKNWIANTEDVTKFYDKIEKKGNIIVELKSDEAEARPWNELSGRLSGDWQQLLVVRGDVTDTISCGRIDSEEVYDDALRHNSHK